MRKSRRLSEEVGIAAGRIPMVSLRQMLAVAEYLNFRHAANSLGVSQSCVSTRIKTLEEALGILLFERRHRGVRLTEAGQRFVAEVAVGIGHIDLAVQTAGAISNGIEGRLGIGSALIDRRRLPSRSASAVSLDLSDDRADRR